MDHESVDVLERVDGVRRRCHAPGETVDRYPKLVADGKDGLGE